MGDICQDHRFNTNSLTSFAYLLTVSLSPCRLQRETLLEAGQSPSQLNGRDNFPALTFDPSSPASPSDRLSKHRVSCSDALGPSLLILAESVKLVRASYSSHTHTHTQKCAGRDRSNKPPQFLLRQEKTKQKTKTKTNKKTRKQKQKQQQRKNKQKTPHTTTTCSVVQNILEYFKIQYMFIVLQKCI